MIAQYVLFPKICKSDINRKKYIFVFFNIFMTKIMVYNRIFGSKVSKESFALRSERYSLIKLGDNKKERISVLF